MMWLFLIILSSLSYYGFLRWLDHKEEMKHLETSNNKEQNEQR